MKKQKNIPQLRFSEFEGEWKITALGLIAKIYDGTHQTPNYIERGIPFVSVENIENLYSTDKFISSEDFDKDFKTKPKKNDILMTRITAGVIGATAIVSNDNPLAYYVSLALIRINREVDVRFINQSILNDRFKKELHKRIIHVAFPKKINLGDIGKCGISLPLLSEQQKIASFFTTIDEKIIQLKRKKILLEQYKKGVMQKIFSQEIRFKDDNGQKFPNWEKKRLGNIAEIVKGEQLNKELLEEQGDYPCINGGIEPSGFTDKYNSVESTIAISEGGNSCGFVNFIRTKFWCGGHCYKIIIKNEMLNSKLFLFHNLKYNQSKMMRLRVGTGLPNIQKKDINDFVLLDSNSIPEQTKIANFLSAIDEKINHTQKQTEKAEVWKKGMMQQMFV